MQSLADIESSKQELRVARRVSSDAMNRAFTALDRKLAQYLIGPEDGSCDDTDPPPALETPTKGH